MAHATSKLDCRFTTSAADIENALAGLNAGVVHCPASERGDLLVNDRMPFEPATSRFSVPFFALRCVRDNRCVKSHLYQLRLCESRFDVRGPDRIRRNKRGGRRPVIFSGVTGEVQMPCAELARSH